MKSSQSSVCRKGTRFFPSTVVFRVVALSAFAMIAVRGLPAIGQTAVWTYHYDNNRTGWNSVESKLTPANVGSSSFGLLRTVTLNDQVDAQPLVVSGVKITTGSHRGIHDVVYVATEGNSIYAIDVHTGTVLLQPNFGPPVPYPLGCGNNGPNVGINGTPVIDLSSSTMYVVIYTNDLAGPTYRIHALDLGSLTDKVSPQVVGASHILIDGSTFDFNGAYQRQRPGLLLLNGTVYAAFGSFCDFAANVSRGWLLGWSTGTLDALPNNELLDTQSTSFLNFFLSSIWMSGYAPSADDAGNIYFVTGNSSYFGSTYDGLTNIQESVVKVSSDLTGVVDLFTPKNVSALDQADADFGSGGVMILPDQPGAIPHLAVAAGKVGGMFLMNADHLGGFSNLKNHVLGNYPIGACWCGESYFVDPNDGLARVVSSGGKSVMVWQLQSSAHPMLVKVSNSNTVGGGQTGGFFTVISSNGSSNPIIWAVSHPPNAGPLYPIKLWAFDPESGGNTMTTLFQGNAGYWPNIWGTANIVPIVANGQVFVASNMQLQIFGLK